MECLEKKISNNIKTAILKFANGWSGIAVLPGVFANGLSESDWYDCLGKPEKLFDDVEWVIKEEGGNCIAVKNLAAGQGQLKVIIKRHRPENGFRQFFRSFQPAKALRNFMTAMKLLDCGIETARPLAALRQKRGWMTRQSILITEYLENAPNTNSFITEQLSENPVEQFAVKKALGNKLADVLAKLDANGFWHRDSKGSNFIVCQNSQEKYRILLVDMDGIKRYAFRRRRSQYRTLWQLGASLMALKSVNRTDYLRGFITYCNLTGLEQSQRKRVFLRLAALAKLKRAKSLLRAVANDR